MNTQPVSDDQKITLAWTTTTVLDYTASFTLGELLAAVNEERTSHGEAVHPDISDDLHLLEDTWLFDSEDESEGVPRVVTRTITGAPTIPVTVSVFTVTVEGPERHDGEAPYTYVLYAADEHAARDLTLARHIRDNDLDTSPLTGAPVTPDAAVLEGPENTFPGAPEWSSDTPSWAWTDLRTDAEALIAALQMTR